MIRTPELSLRARLLLLVALALVPILAVVLWSAHDQRKRAVTDVKAEALRLTRLAGASQEALIEGTRRLLSVLAEAPEVRSPDPEACGPLLERLHRQNPDYVLLSVIRPDGSFACASRPVEPDVRVDDRDWVRTPLEGGRFRVGAVREGRVSGIPVLTFGYPIRDDEGFAVGVAGAGLDLDWFGRVAAAAELPSGAGVLLLDTEEGPLAWVPEDRPWIQDAEAVRTVLEGPPYGTLRWPLEGGQHQLVGYTRLLGAPDIHLLIGVPESLAFAAVDRDLTIVLLGIGVAALLAMAAAWFVGGVVVLQPVRAVVSAARRLERGDFSARSGLPEGPPELNELGRAFDEMASALQEREAESERAALALSQSEARYRSVVERASEAIFLVEVPSLRVVEANPRFRELLGYRPGGNGATDPDLYDLLHETRDEVDRDVRRVQEARSCYLGERRVRAEDGSILDMEVSASLLAGPGRQMMAAVARDVRQRKRDEELILKLSNAVRQTADHIIITDRTGVIEFVNPAFEEATGHRAEEVVGRTPELLRSSHHDSRFFREMWETILAGGVYRGVVTNRKKNGDEYIEEKTITPLRDAAGRITHFISTGKEITERVRAQRALQESRARLRQVQRMEAVGQLAGGVAHDFNNLLTAILGYTYHLLTLEEGLSAEGTDAAQEIRRAAHRGAALTRQLLAFGRRQVLQPRRLDLNEVVRGMRGMLSRLLGEDVDIVTDLDPELGPAEADPGQLDQVVLNLAVNARDAMPGGGRLLVETRNVELDAEYAARHVGVTPGPYVMLSITDSGQGMDEETASRVFEPFFTTKAPGKGTGLGLSTVYGIVKQSGGNVWVYSERGLGTTFKVYLPRVAGVAEAVFPGDAEPPAEVEGGTETILVAEDEAAVRTLVVQVLQRHGYTVLPAASGPEALETAQSHEGPIHALVTDVVMPGMNGRELADRLAEARPGLRTLFMSGYADLGAMDLGIRDGEREFLQKPFTPEALARKVRGVVARAAAP